MPQFEEELELEVEIKEPSLYNVILHNDDYTSIEFVINILMSVFQKTNEEAHQIAVMIHEKGKGICGIYTFEIAQMKVHQVRELAKKNGYPLLATMEEK